RHTRSKRDWVQTCALPIYSISLLLLLLKYNLFINIFHLYHHIRIGCRLCDLFSFVRPQQGGFYVNGPLCLIACGYLDAVPAGLRSEERRVGRVCRLRSWEE